MEEIQDTSGFYKEENGEWFFAPNYVKSSEYNLFRNGDRTATDGWIWFDDAPVEYINWLNRDIII